ncbi:uncharacterized protein LOC62_04G006272 [Vanrija pseudolonga]|uniref:Uncharacterized protein n=1 Tax=Vanrija pseudolonga TaxID=143232 RepID=A0AAF1BN63_9TREE|nr:hypothetical protein LOC62_04G006272 [Vanrija pseudolonga]
MLFKAAIPFLLLISSGLAAPTASQEDTLEARDADASVPASTEVKREWWCSSYYGYGCSIPCGGLAALDLQ